MSVVRLRSTETSVPLLLLALAFVIVLACELADGGGMFRRYGDLGVALGWACVAMFGFASVLGGLELWRPTTLVISDAGIALHGQWSRPLLPWKDISDFVVLRQGAVTHLGCRLTEAGRPKHPGGWHKLLSFGKYDRWLMTRAGQDLTDVLELLAQRHRASLSVAR
ncbi:hypothetical protein [Brevundimonas lenta]|uniref:PH domain-containing protein n=1 Tax=Brevundimonas lenta TaxID=424796 RepID=A0A7W6NR41_9CAUL|nr:hypothetical protein [Brevundimonas lenta]MBB4084304.1 hypothetical protein [Brevundimonas lenta]